MYKTLLTKNIEEKMTKAELVILLTEELASLQLKNNIQERKKKAEKIISLLEDLQILSLDKPIKTKINTIWRGN